MEPFFTVQEPEGVRVQGRHRPLQEKGAGVVKRKVAQWLGSQTPLTLTGRCPARQSWAGTCLCLVSYPVKEG